MSWRERLATLIFGPETKRFPQPGEIHPSNGLISTPVMGPISFPGWDAIESRRGHEYTVALAMRSAWVMSNLMAIGREFSTASVVIKRRVGEQLQDEINHPFERVWERPNPFMGRSFLSQYWLMSLLLYGKAYLYFIPLLDGWEIWPVPAMMMRPVPDERNFIRAYEFNVKGQFGELSSIMIPSEYICYSRLPHPLNARDGYSPLQAALSALELDLAQVRWNQKFFSKRNAIPSGFVILPTHVSEADFQRVRAEIYDFYGSGDRAVGVIRAGDMDFKSIGLGQRDMDWLESRKLNRAEIDRAMGIPEGYWTASATEANARHAKAALIENTVWPLLVLLAEDLTAQIITRWYDPDLLVTFEDIRPRNIELELRQRELAMKYQTINEIRAQDGLPPLNDARGDLFVAQITPDSGMGTTDMVNRVSNDDAQADMETIADGMIDIDAMSDDQAEREPVAATKRSARRGGRRGRRERVRSRDVYALLADETIMAEAERLVADVQRRRDEVS